MASHIRIKNESKRPRRRGPWKHGAIPVIGLIGDIGAGKSLVASILAEHGAFVLDADAVGHALLQQRPARDRVIARFGKGILAPTSGPDAPPVIDRAALAAVVFADKTERRALESILHPLMRGTMARAIDRTVRRGRHSAVLLDAAILLEAGWNSLCDLIFFVEAPREQRLSRLTAQRGWTESILRAREEAQWSSERKRKSADALIVNDSSLEALREQLNRSWTTNIVSEAGQQRNDSGGSTRREPTAAAHDATNTEPTETPPGL